MNNDKTFKPQNLIALMAYQPEEFYERDEKIEGTRLKGVYDIFNLHEEEREKNQINSNTLITEAIKGVDFSDVADAVLFTYLGRGNEKYTHEKYIQVINFLNEEFGVNLTAYPPKITSDPSKKPLTFGNLASGIEKLVQDKNPLKKE